MMFIVMGSRGLPLAAFEERAAAEAFAHGRPILEVPFNPRLPITTPGGVAWQDGVDWERA